MAPQTNNVDTSSQERSTPLLAPQGIGPDNESHSSTNDLLAANVTLMDTTCPIVAPKAPNTWLAIIRGFILDTWAVEIACTVLGVFCLTLTCYILSQHNNKPLPTFPGGLTLNTIVSILSTASRSAMMSVVSTTISQLKWCWLKDQTRKLQSMQTIDGASRGPSGSISLLYENEGGFLASLGAIITLLSLAYGPSLQRLVEYPTNGTAMPPSKAVASAPQVLNYTFPLAPKKGDTLHNVSSEFDAAVVVGIWSQPARFRPEVSCPSGNCTWPHFKSVGWCSKCEEVRPPPIPDECDVLGWLKDPSKPVPRCSLKLGQGAATDLVSLSDPTWQYASLSTSSNSSDVYRSSNIEFSVPEEVVWTIHQPKDHDANTSSSFLGVANPILVLGRATVRTNAAEPDSGSPNDDNQGRFIVTVEGAEQCVLSLCERQYDVRTTDGLTSMEGFDIVFGSTYEREVIVDSSADEWDPDSSDPFTKTMNRTYMCWQPESHDANINGLGETAIMVDEQNRAFCPVDIYVEPLVDKLVGRAAKTWRRTNYSHIDPFMEAPVPSLDSLNEDDPSPTVATQPTPWQKFSIDSYSGVMFSSDSIRAISTYQQNASTLKKRELRAPPRYETNYTRAAYRRNLSDQLEGIAASLTEWGFRHTQAQFTGTAYVQEVYVSVKWRWLILPAGIQVASTILMILTIWQSSQTEMPPWKTSILPALLHGLEDGSIERTPALERVSGMERTAEDVAVKLTRLHDEGCSVIRRTPKDESKESHDA